jgi:hypothetical protein
MALFAKNKPTKRVEFEGGWVELQHISKGVKDEVISRYTSLYKGMDRATLEKLKDDGTDVVPDSMFDAVGKVQEIDYFTLSHAIKAWSESDVVITEETVKELDKEVFDQISEVVKEMNGLTQLEQKN